MLRPYNVKNWLNFELCVRGHTINPPRKKKGKK